MGLALIAIGLLLTVSGVQNTQTDLGKLLYGDFTGQGSFLWWVASIGIIGSLGYVPSMKGLSNALLGLVFVVFILSNKGVFANFNAALSGSGGGIGTSSNSSGLPALQSMPPLGGK